MSECELALFLQICQVLSTSLRRLKKEQHINFPLRANAAGMDGVIEGNPKNMYHNLASQVLTQM